MPSHGRSATLRGVQAAARVREEARNILMTPPDATGLAHASGVALNLLAEIYGHLELVPAFSFLTRYPVAAYVSDVTPHISRGARPGPEDVRALHEAGFGAVVNLCAEMRDGNYSAITGAGLSRREMEHHHHPMVDMAVPTIAGTVAVLGTLHDLEVRRIRTYVGCHASRLRAGVVVGCFRQAVTGWGPADAVDEARNFGNFIPMQLAFIQRFGGLLTERFDAREKGADVHPELGIFPLKRPGSVLPTLAEITATRHAPLGGILRPALAS